MPPAYDFDDLLVPMLAQLVKRLRVTPSEEEMEHLKAQRDVKELTMFFDAYATGATDRDIYEEIMKPVRLRQQAAREAAEKAEREAREAAEKAERERLEAERKEKERLEAERLAAEKAEAERKAAEEAAKLEAEKKKAAEAKALAEKKEREQREAEERARARAAAAAVEDPYEYELVPMLAQLIKRLRVKPTAEELTFLKSKKEAKELKHLFDAEATGATDRELYDLILAPIRGGNTKVDAERKAKTTTFAISEQLSTAAAESTVETKKQDATVGSTSTSPSSAENKTTTDTKPEETTVVVDNNSNSKKEDGMTEEERYDAKMAKRYPGKCAHCGKWITEKNYLANGGTYLHNGCLDAYQEANAPKCHQCSKPVVGEYVELTSAVTKQEVTLHPDCIDAFKKATRPNCTKCGEQILDATMAQLGPDAYYHHPCV